MEVIETHATRRQRGNAVRELGKSLLLPLLAVGFIVLSFLALFFVDAGTTQLSLWVSDADGELQQRVDTISLGAPLLVRPEGTEGSPAPLGCAGRGREVVLQSNEANAGEALLTELAARDLVPCGGLSSKANVRASDS